MPETRKYVKLSGLDKMEINVMRQELKGVMNGRIETATVASFSCCLLSMLLNAGIGSQEDRVLIDKVVGILLTSSPPLC